MKQKIIIKVQIACHKCRTKALKIAAGASGVVSVTAQGDEAIVVTGRCVDPVELTATLRKKVGVALLLSVEELKDPPPKKEPSPPPPVAKPEKDSPPPAPTGEKSNKGNKEEKEKPKEKEKPTPTPPTPTPPCYYGMPPPGPCHQGGNYYYPQQPQYCMYEIPPPDPNPPCSIM